MKRAVFLDRDGVINELVYLPEHGLLDSPANEAQFTLFPRVGEALRKLSQSGYKLLIISNQPGIAKRHFSPETFARVRAKMKQELKKQGAALDGEYYCLHHPEAKVAELQVSCDCRKPAPGLILQAARENDIDLKSSWMIGDGLTDVQAGKSAGCRTILLGKMKCELCHLMEENGSRPDAIAADLREAAEIILSGEQNGNLH
ncbi:MAG: HAD family hydrolase [Dehalococcoidales bacterium]|nr:HAD family hydrolase [Dehalococcoidales bacterium]